MKPLSNVEVDDIHKAFAKHPVTGKKLLFVNASQTTHINDVPRAESDAVMKFLADHFANPEWVVRFKWTPHSIAVWDKRCTHHRAIWDYHPNVRSGFRIQIKGSQPPIPAYA